MKQLFSNILYYILYGICYAYSSMPARIHYFNSTLLFMLIYHVVHYRRKVVRRNLEESFPEKSVDELRLIERRFYKHFCDVIIESVIYFAISEEQMRQRMVFKGAEMLEATGRDGRCAGIYLGHYCNWEWCSSLPLWLNPEYIKASQLYHPLEDKAFDRLLGYIRSRMGGLNIPVEQSLRHIMKYRKEGTQLVVGFIADQVPLYRNIHYWTNFLNHETGMFTGAERIIKMLDMDVYYLHLRRVSRGHYEAEFRLMYSHAKGAAEFELTELYTRMLEDNIKEDPALWLWTHRRWKRTRDVWEKEQLQK